MKTKNSDGAAFETDKQNHKAFELYDRKKFREAFDMLLPLADAGNAEARFRLGILFENGMWREEGSYIPAALYYYYLAALLGHAQGQVHLAALLEEYGEFSEAAHWLEKAALSKNETAACALGFRYHYGIGVSPDFKLAKFWMKNAAAHHPVAKAWLCEHQRAAFGCEIIFLPSQKSDYAVTKDFQQCDREHPARRAYDRVGPLGKIVLRWKNHDYVKMTDAVDAEIEASLVNSGIEKIHAGDFDSACEDLIGPADFGNPIAQEMLGGLFENPAWRKPYFPAALFYTLRAAGRGRPEAMIRLALWLESLESHVEAIRFWERAALTGHPVAQTALAYRLVHGLGTAVDFKRALALFELAAEQGENFARDWLIDGYAYGNGLLKPCLEKERFWKFRDLPVLASEFIARDPVTGAEIETDPVLIESYDRQQYEAVFNAIRVSDPVCLWLNPDDWKLIIPNCPCGDADHTLTHWVTLNGDFAGRLILHHCNTASAEAFIDRQPLRPDLFDAAFGLLSSDAAFAPKWIAGALALFPQKIPTVPGQKYPGWVMGGK